MLDDKVPKLRLALLGKVAPSVPHVREIGVAAVLRHDVGKEEAVLAAELVEGRVRVPESVACKKAYQSFGHVSRRWRRIC